ncbi:MAG: hypothetical protein GXP62_06670, partial [Oligoflexia bacterium]|nr:hypothetical protein [Oligoflexia bacterium]
MARVGLLKAVVLSLDLLAVSMGLWTGHELWTWYKPHLEMIFPVSWADLWLPNPFMPSGIALALVWLIVMRQVGLYDPDRMTSSVRIANGVTRAAAVVLVVVMVLQFLLPDRTYSRSLVLGTVACTAVLLGLLRLGFFQI